MVSFDQVVKGIASFIEAEIISILPGWKKWVTGSLTAMVIDRSAHVFKAVKDYPAIKTLGLVCEDGMIDIESLYKYMRASADKTGPITIDIPMAGSFKVSAQDVDRLYQSIIGG